ncbi:MAG: ABC transporter permease subunit [Deltaproteobacteria bacterium]|nr:ABC transporter permease subunit [Deltaproteobacteria bacterium]
MLGCVCACGGGTDAPGQTYAGIQQRGEIRWGADRAGGEPFVFEDPTDTTKLIGFEVDIMDALSRRLGVKHQMVQHTWSQLVPSLQRGDFDIVINGLEATQERRDQILLSDPYFIYAETLAVRKGDPYMSIFDLAGRRVGTLNQTYAFDIIGMLPLTLAPYEGNEEPYIDLELGRVDGVLLDNIIADRYGCKRDRVHCLPYDVARGAYAIGIRKNDVELKAALDGALAAMKKDGELEKILTKWKLWDHRQTEAISDSVAPAPRGFDWDMVRNFLEAAWLTLVLSVLAFLIAVPLGVLLAIGRVYGGPFASTAARMYIELFRGTPVLLQLFVLYYGIGDYINFGPIQAGVIGLGLNYAAYEAEVYRGALLAIPRGQSEASRALGMGPFQTLRHIMVPQAFRLALPPMTNDFVALLKDSSLVSTIAAIELTKRMQMAALEMRSYVIPGLLCAALYLLLSFPLSELARRLERRLARDQRPHAL